MNETFVPPIPQASLMSPANFERAVAAMFSDGPHTLDNFNVEHSADLAGAEGSYEIDALVTFRLAGMDFKLLVECKNQKRAVDVVQVLHSRLQSIGSQKGAIFSTGGFQFGAIRYAHAHGIALIHLCDGATIFETRGHVTNPSKPAWLPEFAGRSYSISENGNLQSQLLQPRDPWMREFFQNSSI